jgi:hypothetical protein
MTVSNKDQQSQQVPDHYYDDDYVRHYIQNPKDGKKVALLKAGYIGEYAAQEAYRIHKRVRDKIRQAITENISDLDAMAYDQLKGILGSDLQEIGVNNMLSAIAKGLDYSGHKPGDVLTLKREESINDLDTANYKLIKQIANDEGKTISQVITELENPQTTTQH